MAAHDQDDFNQRHRLPPQQDLFEDILRAVELLLAPPQQEPQQELALPDEQVDQLNDLAWGQPVLPAPAPQEQLQGEQFDQLNDLAWGQPVLPSNNHADHDTGQLKRQRRD